MNKVNGCVQWINLRVEQSIRTWNSMIDILSLTQFQTTHAGCEFTLILFIYIFFCRLQLYGEHEKENWNEIKGGVSHLIFIFNRIIFFFGCAKILMYWTVQIRMNKNSLNLSEQQRKKRQTRLGRCDSGNLFSHARFIFLIKEYCFKSWLPRYLVLFALHSIVLPNTSRYSVVNIRNVSWWLLFLCPNLSTKIYNSRYTRRHTDITEYPKQKKYIQNWI